GEPHRARRRTSALTGVSVSFSTERSSTMKVGECESRMKDMARRPRLVISATFMIDSGLCRVICKDMGANTLATHLINRKNGRWCLVLFMNEETRKISDRSRIQLLMASATTVQRAVSSAKLRVITIGWLGCPERALNKYNNWWKKIPLQAQRRNEKGEWTSTDGLRFRSVEVLSIRPSMSGWLFPAIARRQSSRFVAQDLKNFMMQARPEDKLIVHSFSANGNYFY
ncbi:hypothetical protein PROFUN_17153, partial [Planoprotostelium fungivorum]